jgi:hypothetical protein
MKLPELSFRKLGDMVFPPMGVVAGVAMYEMYVGHNITVTGIIGSYTAILAISALYYIYFEKTPLDSFQEAMG